MSIACFAVSGNSLVSPRALRNVGCGTNARPVRHPRDLELSSIIDQIQAKEDVYRACGEMQNAERAAAARSLIMDIALGTRRNGGAA